MFSTTKRFSLSIAALACGLIGGAASAQNGYVPTYVPVVTASNTTTFTAPSVLMGGFTFTVNTPLVINAFGFWDEGKDGIVTSHEIRLWDDSGNVIASTRIEPSSLHYYAGSPNGQWYVNSLPSQSLATGVYHLAAQYAAHDPDIARLSSTISGNGSVVFTDGYYSVGPDLTYSPNQTGNGGVGIFGPMLFGTINYYDLVPEPAFGVMAMVLTGIAACGTLLRRRRR